jgi:hypothetical protein
MNLFAWIFSPSAVDLIAQTTWPYPANYVKAQIGEIRFRKGTAIAMNDTTIFEPGWKRCSAQDTLIGDDA